MSPFFVFYHHTYLFSTHINLQNRSFFPFTRDQSYFQFTLTSLFLFLFAIYFFLHTFQYETGFFPIETGEKIILLHTLIIFPAPSYLSVLNDLRSLFGCHIVTCHFSRSERSGNCQIIALGKEDPTNFTTVHMCVLHEVAAGS